MDKIRVRARAEWLHELLRKEVVAILCGHLGASALHSPSIYPPLGYCLEHSPEGQLWGSIAHSRHFPTPQGRNTCHHSGPQEPCRVL